MKLVKSFVEIARAAKEHGGRVHFEWPRYCTRWLRQEMVDVLQEFDFYEACFDG